MNEVLGSEIGVSSDLIEQLSYRNDETRPHILVTDDSSVARNQIKRAMEQIGIDVTLANNGQEGLQQLKSWADEGMDVPQNIPLMISDIEMPEMDGYTLTKEVRKDPRIAGIKILLHSSMSGSFNESMVEKVGADQFIPKFSPDDLAKTVQEMIAAAKLKQG